MSRNRTTVSRLALEANIDPDEALITLWDDGFDGLNTPADIIPRGHTNRARRSLGLDTRRELSTPEYWQKRLGVDRESLDAWLGALGVPHPYDGTRLRKKAIHRLQSVARLSAPVTHENGDASAVNEAAYADFKWEPVGHVAEIRYLEVEDVSSIHETLVEDFRSAPEPINPAGVRSENLLASAVMRPHTGIGDDLKYPTVEMAAAALFHSLVHDHAFHNGNKRTAVVGLLVFLDRNGLVLTCPEDDLFFLVLRVAQHAFVTDAPRSMLPDVECFAIAKWIKANSRWIEKGDRALPWRRLEQILDGYGCRFSRSGSNVTITRIVSRRVKYLPMLSNTRTLKAQTHVSNAGRDVLPAAINQLRRDLELNDDHGVDSSAFYDEEEISTSDFIARYRKTLNRLARL